MHVGSYFPGPGLNLHPLHEAVDFNQQTTRKVLGYFHEIILKYNTRMENDTDHKYVIQRFLQMNHV